MSLSKLIDNALSQVTGDIRSIAGASGVSVAVTYRRHTGDGPFNKALGYPVGQYEETTANAVRARSERGEAPTLYGTVEAGDSLFLFLESGFPAASTLSLKDQIVIGGQTFNVKGISPLPGGLGVAVSVQGAE